MKTLAQASNSFSNVYKNLDNFDERNLKYYLASYEKVRGQLNEMKLAPFNVSDAQIAAYEQVFLTMEKNLKSSTKGRKMLADAKILAGGNLKLSNFLENTPKISFQGTTIRGVKFNSTDNFIDVIIHADANGYKILIEKQGTYVYQNITADDLASIITQNAPISSNKTLRLLSCSNLESAKSLSSALGGRKILASNSSVTLFLDGSDNVSSIKSSDWYEIQKVGNDITQTKTTLNFDNGNTQKWVKMGSTLLENLAKTEANIRHLTIENAIVFNKNGDEIVNVVGEAEKVKLPPGDYKGMILTHNHPNTSWEVIKLADPTFTGTSFSVDDIRKLEVDEFFEIRAVPKLSNDIVYSLKKSDGTNFNEEDEEAIIYELNKIWINRTSSLDAILAFVGMFFLPLSCVLAQRHRQRTRSKQHAHNQWFNFINFVLRFMIFTVILALQTHFQAISRRGCC